MRWYTVLSKSLQYIFITWSIGGLFYWAGSHAVCDFTLSPLHKSFPFPSRAHPLLHHCWSGGRSAAGRGADPDGDTSDRLLQEEAV